MTAIVNLTQPSGQFAYITPLPSPSSRPSAPTDDRVTLRIRRQDGSTRLERLIFKPDTCRQPDDDVTGLVDTVVPVEADAVGLDLLLDGDVMATFEASGAPSVAENLRVTRSQTADPGGRGQSPAGVAMLSWEDPNARGRGLGESDARYAVQASTDSGQTWMTLAVGTTDTALPVDAEQFPDARRVRFRVLTTNGFSQTVAETPDLSVETL